jgi:uncharacterized protein YfaS (alpha-2-macroglobulin family)
METKSRKSQFYWNLQTWIFISLVFVSNANAGDLYPSKFQSYIGKKFFLLSDTTFAPTEVAKVRLEIRKNYNDRKKVENYGGADIAIYKVKDPLKFLKSQKNLHRITTKYNYKPKGLISNALSYVWDSFYKKSRLAWQRVLSFNARKSAIETSDKFRQKPAHTYKTKFKHYKQFGKIKGFELLNQFRYPITEAKPIQPPNVKLSGSSHNFRKVNPGNVYIPLGKLESGLYLVEAVIGDHRANTLVFVSDSVLISKSSSNELFMWTVSKKEGNPIPNTSIIISDGLGVIKKGKTNNKGVLSLKMKTPELVYFIGKDSSGGVFISENYYYDSEIYAEKLYTFTDRPLYRPGDKVSVKVIGRKFINSSTSQWLKNKTFKALVLDSAGTIILTKKFKVKKKNAGGEFSFRLPSYALPGGYTVILKDKLKTYTSEFRVSKYTKPHYNIDILFSKKKFKLNEKISGNFKLTYSNGKPVKGAEIELVVRRQKLNIIEGERDAESLFPVKVDEFKMNSDDKGAASFELPEVNVPSRYILSVKSKDDASFRVKASKELLVELDTPTFAVVSEKLFSNKDDSVSFKLEKKLALTNKEQKGDLSWKIIRLEDQSEQKGEISGLDFKVKFEKSGTYKILILNKDGSVVGGKPHIVRGDDLKTLPGTVHIVLDKEEYDLNDTVKAFINFSVPVDNALLTLERDKVENFSISGNDSSWISIDKTSKSQWVAEIPVKKMFAPNVTLSVLFVKDGKFVFNNKGIRVKIPKIKVVYDLPKLDFSVGEKVKMGITTTYLDKPISSNITLSVVDEMIYVLQPELAPKISDFFYHRRRNQVKTISSLDFHTYDASISATGRTDYSSDYSDRPLKMRERPRRENVDTALWKTNLRTNKDGKVTVEFKVPDSITRWRITSRAISSDGAVGQSIAHIKSLQSAYLKWGGLTDFRKGDETSVNVMAFNLEPKDLDGQLVLKGAGVDETKSITLKPGINFTPVTFTANKTQDISLALNGKDYSDKLVKKIEVIPTNWLSTMSKDMKLKKGKNTLELPKEAFNYRLVAFNNLYQRFLKAAEDLIVYPHGCVEQTASRLIPLSIAYGILKRSKDKRGDLEKIREKVINGRDRLVTLANQRGFFGWYDNMPNDSYMTAYAYLAFSFTHEHWEKILEAFRDYSSDNVLRNSVVLWISAHVGKPVQSMVEAQITEIEKGLNSEELKSNYEGRNFIMSRSSSKKHHELASIMLKLATIKLSAKGYKLPKEAMDKLESLSSKAISSLEDSSHPLLRSAVLSLKAIGKKKQEIISEAEQILKGINRSYSTADRSLALILMHESLGKIKLDNSQLKLTGPVKKIKSIYGLDSWQITGKESAEVNLTTSVDSETEFRLYYDTYKKDKHELAVKITRNIYSLEKRENKYISSIIDLKSGVNTEGKFIDEIIIEPDSTNKDARFDYGMIEIPLPPGASVESNLGKIEVIKITESGSDETVEIDEVSRPGSLKYKIPVKELTERKVFRHVIQFSAKGKYKMPMARFFKMYTPDKKAYRANNEPAIWELNVN